MNNSGFCGFMPPHLLAGLPETAPVLLGFSGGADSSALFSFLAASCKKHGAPLYAAHLDHMIRPDEHDRDRIFCENVAKKYGVKLFTLCVDLPAEAKKSGESLETAARRIRYAFFEKIMRDNGIPLLATAHNADDNLETLLLNLIRGSGIGGMCGIPVCRPFANGFVVRPILSMTKDDVYDYCELNGIDFVTDSTNLVADCSRNRLRLNVIPELKDINPSASENAARMCGILRRDAEYLDAVAADFVSEAGQDGRLPLSKLNLLPDPIFKRAVAILYSRQSGCRLEAVQLEAIFGLCRRSVAHSSVSLPERLKATIEDGSLVILPDTKKKYKSVAFSVTLRKGENRLPNGLLLCVSDKAINIYKSETTAVIASATIKGNIFARNRLPGDSILLNRHHHSLKKLMCEKKIPLALRDLLPVVCDSEKIIFVPYIGICDGLSGPACDKMTYITLSKELL